MKYTDEEYISRAREIHAIPSNDDIEIDDKPALSHADEGCWVAAWVWVANAELGEDEDEEEPDSTMII